MKLKLKGYILQRLDTNEYLNGLVLFGNSAIVGWTSSKCEADLSEDIVDAMTTGILISNAIKVEFKLFQLFRFRDGYLASCIAKYIPKQLESEMNFTRL
jgi:hypothetical protein